MNIHTDAPTLTDRVALSNALYELAESCALEASMWLGGRLKAELNRSATLLGRLARNSLVARVDHAKAEAYLDAGQRMLASAQAARRLLAAADRRKARR